MRYYKFSILFLLVLLLGSVLLGSGSFVPSNENQFIEYQKDNRFRISSLNPVIDFSPSNQFRQQPDYQNSSTRIFQISKYNLDLVKYPNLQYEPPTYSLSLIQSDPIQINDTQQLINLGLPGLGSKLDPYRIENYAFSTNSSLPAINITGIIDHILISNNTFLHNSSSILGGGIIIKGSSNIDVIDNTFANQDFPPDNINSINLISSSQINILNNIFNSTQGINVANSNDFILQNNTLYSTHFDSIAIDTSSNFILDKNSVTYSGGAGIYVEGPDFSFDFQITNNQITGSHGAPMTIHYGSNFEIIGNFFSSDINPANLLGVTDSREQSEIRWSEDFVIDNNDFLGAPVVHSIGLAQYGMLKLEDSTNGTVILNTFNDYDWGRPEETRKDIGTVRVLNFVDLTFANNSIDNSDVTGLYMARITNATIDFNVISNHELEGIFVAESSSILIKNNDIFQTSIGIRVSQVGNEFNGYTEKPTDIKIYDNILSNNQFGISLLSTELVHIKDNSVLNSEYGIDLVNSNQIDVEQNTVTQSLRGINMGGLDDSIINNNIIHNNIQDGIFISQIFSPGKVLVQDNSIYDQNIRGARGINIETKLDWKNSGIEINGNMLEGNSVGIELYGSGVIISENLIFDQTIPDVELSNMEFGLKINPGSKYNQIIFNEFDEAIFSHIFIRSSNSLGNKDLISKDNLIAWNNFYSFTVIQAFDEYGLNQFIYNFWSNLNSTEFIGSNGILDTELQIISSPNAPLTSYDFYPLSTPFQETSVFTNPMIPFPIFLTPLDGMSLNNSRNGQIIIEFEWIQSISSDQFMFGNETKFEFSIEYKSASSNDWINIEDKIVDTDYIWNVTALPNDFYEIRITGKNLITQRNGSSIITINLGPIVPTESFFDSPRNIVFTITVAVGLTTAVVYGITTYRQNIQRKRDADVKGRARDYIDIARRIKEEEG